VPKRCPGARTREAPVRRQRGAGQTLPALSTLNGLVPISCPNPSTRRALCLPHGWCGDFSELKQYVSNTVAASRWAVSVMPSPRLPRRTRGRHLIRHGSRARRAPRRCQLQSAGAPRGYGSGSWSRRIRGADHLVRVPAGSVSVWTAPSAATWGRANTRSRPPPPRPDARCTESVQPLRRRLAAKDILDVRGQLVAMTDAAFVVGETLVADRASSPSTAQARAHICSDPAPARASHPSAVRKHPYGAKVGECRAEQPRQWSIRRDMPTQACRGW